MLDFYPNTVFGNDGFIPTILSATNTVLFFEGGRLQAESFARLTIGSHQGDQWGKLLEEWQKLGVVYRSTAEKRSYVVQTLGMRKEQEFDTLTFGPAFTRPCGELRTYDLPLVCDIVVNIEHDVDDRSVFPADAEEAAAFFAQSSHTYPLTIRPRHHPNGVLKRWRTSPKFS